MNNHSHTTFILNYMAEAGNLGLGMLQNAFAASPVHFAHGQNGRLRADYPRTMFAPREMGLRAGPFHTFPAA
jgi:hypothetical protein